MLISAANDSSRVQDKDSSMTQAILRDSAKHILYTVVNSNMADPCRDPPYALSRERARHKV